MYEVNGKQYDYWSETNQRILDILVDREVYCCMTSEMEYMLKKAMDYDEDCPFDEDDFDRTFVESCPHCGCQYSIEEIAPHEIDDDDIERDEDGTYLCSVCGASYEDIEDAKYCCDYLNLRKCHECNSIFDADEVDSSPAEIYEWWAVSRWFGEKLKDKGEVIIESYGKSYWGRTCTGQTISLDGCIANIAKDMGILEGMEYSWENKK